MSKLYNIKGYWNMGKKPFFIDDQSWTGQILLDEDGWFEGVVQDTNSLRVDRFVFGVYGPEKGIELHKLVPLTLSDPFIFHGIKEEEGYEGEFEAIHLFGSKPVGVSRIQTDEVLSDNLEQDIQVLKNRIQSFKDDVLEHSAKDLYINSLAMRNAMCKIILGNFDGKLYTRNEMEELMAECKPINDKVVDQTVEEAKRLVLEHKNKQQKSSSSFYGDELPFEI